MHFAKLNIRFQYTTLHSHFPYTFGFAHTLSIKFNVIFLTEIEIYQNYLLFAFLHPINTGVYLFVRLVMKK